MTEETPVKITRCRPKIGLDAVRVDAGADWGAIAEWCNGDVVSDEQGRIGVRVVTNWGLARADEGDWIVQGTTGAWMVYDAEKFAELYEQVAE